VDPAHYSSSTKWKIITTGTTGVLTRATTGSLNLEIWRPFNTNVNCNDLYPHSEQSEHCRIGTSQEALTWFSDLDRTSGRVDSVTLPNGTTGTVGAFWSHVVYDGSATTSTRDQTSVGKLRDNYEYVETPLMRPPAPLPTVLPTPCTFGNCNFFWRPDWHWDPAPIRDYTDPPLIALVSWPARVIKSTTNLPIAVGGSTQPLVDMTTALSSSAATIINRTDFRWLTPSEPGSTVNRFPGAAPYVAMANNWRKSARRPSVFNVVSGVVQPLAVGTPPPNTPGFIPGDRNGAAAFYSARERSVVMVGGHHPTTGRVTSEVWSYNIDTDVWTRTFADKVQVPVRDVIAIAYDAKSKRFVTLDRWVNPADSLTYARLVLFDTTLQTSTVVKQARDTGRYVRFGLVSDADGSFIITGQPASGTVWDGYRFRVDSGILSWVSSTHPAGTLLDAPVRMSSGVFVPVFRDPSQEMVLLTSSMFVTDTTGIVF
jgi:hypothetical protein